MKTPKFDPNSPLVTLGYLMEAFAEIEGILESFVDTGWALTADERKRFEYAKKVRDQANDVYMANGGT